MNDGDAVHQTGAEYGLRETPFSGQERCESFSCRSLIGTRHPRVCLIVPARLCLEHRTVYLRDEVSIRETVQNECWLDRYPEVDLIQTAMRNREQDAGLCRQCRAYRRLRAFIPRRLYTRSA
jgi:hypothetical protein